MSLYPELPSQKGSSRPAASSTTEMSMPLSGKKKLPAYDAHSSSAIQYPDVSALYSSGKSNSADEEVSESCMKSVCCGFLRPWSYITASYFLFFEKLLTDLGAIFTAFIFLIGVMTVPLCGIGLVPMWFSLLCSRWFTKLASKSYRYVSHHVVPDPGITAKPDAGGFFGMFKDSTSWKALVHTVLVRPLIAATLVSFYQLMWIVGVLCISAPATLYIVREAMPSKYTHLSFILVPVGVAICLIAIALAPALARVSNAIVSACVAPTNVPFSTRPSVDRSSRRRPIMCYAFGVMSLVCCCLVTLVVLFAGAVAALALMSYLNCHADSRRFTKEFHYGNHTDFFSQDVDTHVTIVPSADAVAASAVATFSMAGSSTLFDKYFSWDASDTGVLKFQRHDRSLKTMLFAWASCPRLTTTITVPQGEASLPRYSIKINAGSVNTSTAAGPVEAFDTKLHLHVDDVATVNINLPLYAPDINVRTGWVSLIDVIVDQEHPDMSLKMDFGTVEVHKLSATAGTSDIQLKACGLYVHNISPMNGTFILDGTPAGSIQYGPDHYVSSKLSIPLPDDRVDNSVTMSTSFGDMNIEPVANGGKPHVIHRW